MSVKQTYNKPLDLEQVRAFIQAQSADTKVYLGCDSERVKIGGTWFADYMRVVVVHIDGNKGCKIFGGIHRERDYDAKISRPANRLMNEVYQVSELYLELAEVIGDREVQIHLDVNASEKYGSNCVMQQAVGYIRGVCGLEPKLKPEAPAASFCADRFKYIRDLQDAELAA